MNTKHDAGPNLLLSDLVELNRLFREHGPRLRTMLQSRIDPRFAARISADDLIQEAFIAAQYRWGAFKASTLSPLGWLYRLSLDRLFEAVRRETRECRDVRKDDVFPDHSGDQFANRLVDSITSGSRALERDEVRALVREAVSLLNEKDQQILWMTFLDGLSPADIAAAIDMSRDAVYKRLGRALLRLRSALADIDPDGWSIPNV